MERLIFEDPDLAARLFGPQNLHLDILSRESGAHIFNRGSTLCIDVEDQNVLNALTRLFCTLYDELSSGSDIEWTSLAGLYKIYARHGGGRREEEIRRPPLREKKESKACRKSGREKEIDEAASPSEAGHGIAIQTPRKTVYPRNASQEAYLKLLQQYEIVFALGPAGTGKTYLAVAYAVELLRLHKIKKIILTRPAVEAGEKLGFLPGDLIEKINPYLRPLYDALYDMLPQARVAALTELGSIEIAPLAFMRGRTLNDSVIILDEAQNTTREQMKMFLTRMGFGSRMIITGDSTQIDLPPDSTGSARQSGLIHARSILNKIPAIAFHTFTKEDVVRHQLVGEIVHAYDIAENRRPETKNR